MGLKKYCEYFTIDKSYRPAIDPESKKDPSISWKTTYPHQSFIDLLDKTEKMLGRGTNIAKKSIWVDGSYGTGKSRLVWALENLLTCSDEEFDEYFDRYEVLRRESDLRAKLSARRRDKIVVISDYSTGEIGSINDLCRRVFEKVTEALEKEGMDTIPENTVRGRIADKIMSEDFRPVFGMWISNPKYRGKSGLSGKTVDEIADQLRDISATSDSMVRSILDIAKEQGFYVFSFDVDFLMEWIKEVIRINDIDNIVFLWDEFSDFFKKLKRNNEYGSFQKLVDICTSTPFNFIVVTHEADAMKNEGGEASALHDRFTHQSVSMPDKVAFELIHDALKINPTPGIQEEYDDLTNELAGNTFEARKAVCAFAGIDEKLMRSILPIHPMAALLLKYISSEFAANQRSMFNFIKTEDADKLQAFQWFIKNKSPENGDILTIDYLWNFFYEAGTDENTTATGRSNLDIRIAQILDSYVHCEAKLSSKEEKRVLKTILMLQAISKKLNNGVELLKPTERNIALAFCGDEDLNNSMATNIIKNKLLPNNIILKDTNGRVEEYGAYVIMGDQTEINKRKEGLRNAVKTARLVKDGAFLTAFSFSDALKSRYDFSVSATADDIQNAANRINNENTPYKFRTVICFARDEAEQKKMKDKLAELTADPRYASIVFIDASSTLMGMDNWENWLELTAREQHFRNPDPTLADSKAEEAKKLLIDWKSRITGGRFTMYVGADYVRHCDSISLLYEELASYVLSKYPLTFDNVKVANTVFTDAKYANSAKLGIGVKSGSVFQDKHIDLLLGEVRHVEKYWEVYPSHSISQLKVKTDNLISDKMDRDGRISIAAVIDLLMEQGFTPCSLYAYLTGFLLKEYSAAPYRFSEGENGDHGGEISPEKLGNMIGEYFKHLVKNGRYVEQYIEKMSPDQAAFVSFVSETFGLHDLSIVENAANKLRTQYKDKIRYPLWCFKCIDDIGLDEYISKLSEIMYPRNETNVPTLAGEFGKMLLQDEQRAKEFSTLITPENAANAMKRFLDEFENGAIPTYAEKIGVVNMLGDVADQIAKEAKSYLWDQQEGEEQLRKLLLEYRIIDQTNALLSPNSNTINSCYRTWKRFSETLKLPYAVIKKHYSELSKFVECLLEINTNDAIPDDKRQQFLEDITNHSDLICKLHERIADIYASGYSISTSGLSMEEINAVMSEMPNSSFMDDDSDFESNLRQRADKKRKEQKKYQLEKLWKEKTGSDSPKMWSETHLMPIKVLVDDADMDEAEKLFDVFTGLTTAAEKIDQSLVYLENDPAFISRMCDPMEIENAFRVKILGRYSAVIHDLCAVKDHIQNSCVVSVYDWYGSPAVQKLVKEFASSVYRTSANTEVMHKIDDMSPEEAKAYLKKLVKNDVEVGISIINREGGE